MIFFTEPGITDRQATMFCVRDGLIITSEASRA